MQFTTLAWLGGLLGLAQGYGYGYSGYTAGTGTSPATLPTGASGTDPSSSVPSTSAPYGNSTTSYYYPSGTAPYSTGISSTSVDPNTTTWSSYGTASGAPYKTWNSSAWGDPTAGTTHGPYPYPSGTVASTGDPSTKTVASTGDPSASGSLAYTAPTGIPSEYYFHHKKPKRNSRYFGRYGFRA